MAPTAFSVYLYSGKVPTDRETEQRSEFGIDKLWSVKVSDQQRAASPHQSFDDTVTFSAFNSPGPLIHLPRLQQANYLDIVEGVYYVSVLCGPEDAAFDVFPAFIESELVEGTAVLGEVCQSDWI